MRLPDHFVSGGGAAHGDGGENIHEFSYFIFVSLSLSTPAIFTILRTRFLNEKKKKAEDQVCDGTQVCQFLFWPPTKNTSGLHFEWQMFEGFCRLSGGLQN